MSIRVTVNGVETEASDKSSVLQHLTASDLEIPHVCYHPSLGAIETCDTCIVSVNGELVRSCSTGLKNGDVIETASEEVRKAQVIGMDRILHNHELYCTVCDYNNGNCEVHNTVKEMKVNHQSIPFEPKNHMKQIGLIRIIAMIRISASFAGVVWKHARMYR